MTFKQVCTNGELISTAIITAVVTLGWFMSRGCV